MTHQHAYLTLILVVVSFHGNLHTTVAVESNRVSIAVTSINEISESSGSTHVKFTITYWNPTDSVKYLLINSDYQPYIDLWYYLFDSNVYIDISYQLVGGTLYLALKPGLLDVASAVHLNFDTTNAPVPTTPFGSYYLSPTTFCVKDTDTDTDCVYPQPRAAIYVYEVRFSQDEHKLYPPELPDNWGAPNLLPVTQTFPIPFILSYPAILVGFFIQKRLIKAKIIRNR